MPKLHVKKGDEVVVLAGSSKGTRGRVITVTGNKDRVIVEGAQIVKRHMRKSQQHPEGGLLWLEGPIHVSNVMKVDEFERRRTAKVKAA